MHRSEAGPRLCHEIAIYGVHIGYHFSLTRSDGISSCVYFQFFKKGIIVLCFFSIDYLFLLET